MGLGHLVAAAGLRGMLWLAETAPGQTSREGSRPAQSATRSALPVWRPAEMPGLDGAGWSPVQEINGRQCRLARGGRGAVLSVPVWWGGSFRPPEGTVHILRVRYQDTATQPVVASAHAGVAVHWGMSEVHRFGGTGDGQWKTADVPVSWDLICRKVGTDNRTEIAFSANKDLPVESIELLPVVDEAGPSSRDAAADFAKPGQEPPRISRRDAAARYFDETRAWVERAQGAKRAAASLGPATQPALDDSLRNKPLVAYPWPWYQPHWPNTVPTPRQVGQPVKIRMARNESESAAFAVYANLPFQEVSWTVTSWSDGRGPACDMDMRAAEYSAVQETVDYGRTKDSGKYRLYPQRLWPDYAPAVPAGRSQMFWLTLKGLGQRTSPGTYKGTIVIVGLDGQKKAHTTQLPLEVEVLPITLLTPQEAGFDLGNCTLGLPTLQEVKTLVEHGHTGMDLWFGCTQPGMKIVDGKLIIDWTYMDDWMAYARQAGMTHMMWFFGGDPKDFPGTLNLERDLYARLPKVEGRADFYTKTRQKPERVVEDVRGLYVDFVHQLALHAIEKDWPRMIVQPFDEPGKWRVTLPPSAPVGAGSGPWIKDHFKDGCNLIKQALKDVPGSPVEIGLEAHVVEPCLEFLPDVNVFCTNRAYTLPGLVEKLKAANVQLWQYANCDDQAPAHRCRYSFGFYFASFGARGSLVWAYNWQPRFDTSAPGNWGSAWYTPFGTIMAPSLVGFREGMDDRRWVETARRLGQKKPGVSKVLEDVLREAAQGRAKTRYDSYNEADDPARLDEWRGRLMDAMLAD